MCPHCGRDAPIVYRGIAAYCTACAGLRAPLSARSVNLAGRPSKLGGTVATTAGRVLLVVGLPFAAVLGGAFWLLASVLAMFGAAGGAPLALGLGIFGTVAAVVLAASAVLEWRGRRLAAAGAEQRRHALHEALIELARERGSVSAADAARAMGVPEPEADALLTQLAKADPARIELTFDDEGRVSYRAAGDAPRHARIDERGAPGAAPLRVATAAGAQWVGADDAEDGAGDPGSRARRR